MLKKMVISALMILVLMATVVPVYANGLDVGEDYYEEINGRYIYQYYTGKITHDSVKINHHTEAYIVVYLDTEVVYIDFMDYDARYHYSTYLSRI